MDWLLFSGPPCGGEVIVELALAWPGAAITAAVITMAQEISTAIPRRPGSLE